jgi:hypothetical protein
MERRLCQTVARAVRTIIDKPFAAWRVLLHPSQRRVAHGGSYNGPAQVTGGPGTGKTVIARSRGYGLGEFPGPKTVSPGLTDP